MSSSPTGINRDDNVAASPFVQCDSRLETKVFSHYAYGDPLPIYARFIGEDGEVVESEAISVYVRCEREAGHPGKHLARRTTGWTDADAL